MSNHDLKRLLLALLCLSGGAAFADDSGTALELTEAQRLSVAQQPLLNAEAQAVIAARQSGVAAAQLPDPKLTGGIADWPVDGPERYSLRRDNFTIFSVGVEQDFPRADKRRLLGERGEHEAEMAEQTLITTRLTIQRDAALAWLEVWRPEHALELTRASLHEAELQIQATENAYAAGRATQADLIASRIAASLMRDDAAALEQDALLARSKLSRWIGGDTAQRPLTPQLPAWPSPAPMQDMVDRLRTHPHLNTEAKRVAIAQDEVALAHQAYKPDWSAGINYGYRPDFADYVSLTFRVDLPVFTGNRQDRTLSAKLAEQDEAEQSRENMFRQEEADLRLNWQGWQRLQERLHQFDADILPQSEQRTSAAVAAWQSGQGSLGAVLDARRLSLDNQMKRLDLLTDAARYRLNLLYFSGESP